MEKSAEQPKVDINQALSINTNSGDVILFEGNLDNYLKKSRTTYDKNVASNGNNLLMIQPQTNLDLQSTHTNPSKSSCFILSGPQFINFGVQQLTEKEILTMPTVILCEDNKQKPQTQTNRQLQIPTTNELESQMQINPLQLQMQKNQTQPVFETQNRFQTQTQSFLQAHSQLQSQIQLPSQFQHQGQTQHQNQIQHQTVTQLQSQIEHQSAVQLQSQMHNESLRTQLQTLLHQSK